VPRRMALLVATYSYQDEALQHLTAPGQDAEGLATVLRDPEIAGFEVDVKVNEPHHVVGQAIGEFYHRRRRDDLTLLYFTGHGLKDDQGRLYLAMTDTRHDQLLFTGLSASQVNEAMESSSSRQNLLILDCCYSGAFPSGVKAKAGSQMHTLQRFEGRGRAVLTASDAIQYSFEGNKVSGEGSGSVFTRFLVEGLTSGEADLDGDGNIALDELYAYVHDHVIAAEPRQHPKILEDVEGRIVIAQNIHWKLPEHLRQSVDSPFKEQRLAALTGLKHLHEVGNERVRAEVVRLTRRLTEDDSRSVSAAAVELLAVLDPAAADERTRGEAEEERARQREAEEERARHEAREEQALRRAAEQEARRRAAEEEQARRRAAEQEARRREAEQEARRREAMEHARWAGVEEERARRETEQGQARQRAADLDGPSPPGQVAAPSREREKPRFWRTLPGILTVVAVLLAAVTGMAVVLNQLGGPGTDDPPAPFESTQMYEMAQNLFDPADCFQVRGEDDAPLAWDLAPRPDELIRCDSPDGPFTAIFMCNDTEDVEYIRDTYLGQAIEGTVEDVLEPPAGWDEEVDGVQVSFEHVATEEARVYWDSPQRRCAAELQSPSATVADTIDYWVTGTS
jgi:Caspase domain